MPTDSHLLTLSSVAAMVIGLVVWVLKSALPAIISQYRADVFQMQREHREQLEKKSAECREERETAQARHTEEMTTRDARLQEMIQALIGVAQCQHRQEARRQDGDKNKPDPGTPNPIS